MVAITFLVLLVLVGALVCFLLAGFGVAARVAWQWLACALLVGVLLLERLPALGG